MSDFDLSIFHEDVLEAYDAADKPDGLLFLYVELVKKIENECEYRQQRIDELMLEYCADEMTEDQIENWERHQVESKINL